MSQNRKEDLETHAKVSAWQLSAEGMLESEFPPSPPHLSLHC